MVLILVAIVLFGVGSVLFGRGEVLPPLPRATTATVLPASGVTGADVEAVKFTQTLRGYKTSEVDWVLDRLGQELDPLRGQLAAVQATQARRRRPSGGGTGRGRRACAAVGGQGRFVTATPEDDGRVRCGWIDQSRLAPADFTLYRDYHDTEWGRPLRGSSALFERVSLEAFQSGLSWLIILRKRENFRRAFHRFDIDKVARYTDRDIERLMNDAGHRAQPLEDRGDHRQRARGRRPGRRPRRAAVVVRAAAAAAARRHVARFPRSPRNRRRWPRN